MSGRPINALELVGRFRNELNQPDPFRANEVPVDRGFLAPLATYADGQTELALPAFPLGAIWDGVRSFGAMGFDTPEAIQHNAGAAFDTAGGIVQGGLGVGLAGGLADNAVGSAGGRLTGNAPQGLKAYRGVRDVSQRANDYFPPEAADELAWWGSSSPDVANHYTKGADNSAVIPAEVRFQNPMEFDLQGGHAGNVRYNGRQYVTEEMIPIARQLGHDGLVFKNVRDAARPQDVPVADTVAAIQPGTVYSATTGDLLYSNAPTGSSVPLAANALERAGAQPQGIRRRNNFNDLTENFEAPRFRKDRATQIEADGIGVERINRRSDEGPMRDYFMRVEDQPAGFASLRQRPEGWEVQEVEVAPSYRGQGIASKAYNAIESDLGESLKPSGSLTADGYNFWARRNPEAVKYHTQSDKGGYLSPRQLVEMRDNALRLSEQYRRQGLESVALNYADDAAKISERIASLPPEATDPAYLATIFANAPTASAVALAGEQDTELALEQYLRMIGL